MIGMTEVMTIMAIKVIIGVFGVGMPYPNVAGLWSLCSSRGREPFRSIDPWTFRR